MELKTVIISQARSGSSRLPGKVLLTTCGKSFLGIHAARLLKSTQADEVIIATTVNENDDKICEEAKKMGIKCTRGSEDDVLARYYDAAKETKADIIIRVTSDCPFIDAELIDEMLIFFKANHYDYITNTFQYTYPDGLDAEIMTFASLEKAYKNATLKSEREHVTPYIRKNADTEGGSIFKAYNYKNPEKLSFITRLTLDEEADLKMLSFLTETLGTENSWQVYHNYLADHPEINRLNNHILINEGYYKSKENDAHN